MEALLIKEELHSVVECGDEKLLHLMYALAKEYNDQKENEFTADELNQFKARRENHLNSKSKSYTWEEARSLITQQNKNV